MKYLSLFYPAVGKLKNFFKYQILRSELVSIYMKYCNMCTTDYIVDDMQVQHTRVTRKKSNYRFPGMSQQ